MFSSQVSKLLLFSCDVKNTDIITYKKICIARIIFRLYGN